MKNGIRNYTYAALAALMLVLVACTSTAQNYSYENIFTFEYPSGWYVLSETADLPRHALVAFISPITQSTVSNIVVTVNTVPESWDIDKITEEAKKELSIYPSLQTVESKSVRISGQKTTLDSYLIQTSAKEQRKIIQTYVLRAQTVYTLTATLPANTSDSSVEAIEKAIESFTFIETPAEQ